MNTDNGSYTRRRFAITNITADNRAVKVFAVGLFKKELSSSDAKKAVLEQYNSLFPLFSLAQKVKFLKYFSL
jgi:hypothetical protein